MSFLFFVLSSLILATAIGVVLFRDPVNSALCLVMNMLCVAGVYAMLEAHFLAVVQIIVYAGAVVVLFLFVVMLLNTKLEEVNTRDIVTSLAALVVGGLFLGALLPLLSGGFSSFNERVLSLTAEAPLTGDTASVGRVLYTNYLFPFEAASILLMAALVGAVMLGHRRNGDDNGLNQNAKE